MKNYWFYKTESVMRHGCSRVFAGVEQALGHVTDESTDYYMCQMLRNVMHDEIDKVFAAHPEPWASEIFVY